MQLFGLLVVLACATQATAQGLAPVHLSDIDAQHMEFLSKGRISESFSLKNLDMSSIKATASAHRAAAKSHVDPATCFAPPPSLAAQVNAAIRCSVFKDFSSCDCIIAGTLCGSGSACESGVFCWSCQFNPTALGAAVALCPTCPCGKPYRNEWKCPVDPAISGSTNISFPSEFKDKFDMQRSWHFFVGRLTPENPAYKALGFHYALLRFSTLPNIFSFPTAQVSVHFALSNPNVAAPTNGYNHRNRPNFPPETVAFAYDEATNSFSYNLQFGKYIFQTSPLNTATPGKKGAIYNIQGTETDPTSGRPFSINLTLIDSKGAHFQGDRGFSRKGYQPCSSSQYFSLTALKIYNHPDVTNYVVNGGETIAIKEGEVWYDREQSVAELEDAAARPTCPNNYDAFVPGSGPISSHKGWFWTSLHLAEVGIEITAFRMTTNAATGPIVFDEGRVVGGVTYKDGSVADPDLPRARQLDYSKGEFNLEVLETTGGYFHPDTALPIAGERTYPTKSRITVKIPDLEIDVVCSNIDYADASRGEVRQELTGPQARFHEGLALCEGEVRVFSSAREMCFDYVTSSFAYVERVNAS